MGAYTGDIWSSSDYGSSWVDQSLNNAGTTNKAWFAMTSDSSGKYLVAVAFGGDIWSSSDYGITWENLTTGSPDMSGQSWTGITSDSTGKYLAAIEATGNIWTSTNYGVSWTNQDINNGKLSGKEWYSIASSANGQYLAATTYGGDIWTANDPSLAPDTNIRTPTILNNTNYITPDTGSGSPVKSNSRMLVISASSLTVTLIGIILLHTPTKIRRYF